MDDIPFRPLPNADLLDQPLYEFLSSNPKKATVFFFEQDIQKTFHAYRISPGDAIFQRFENKDELTHRRLFPFRP